MPIRKILIAMDSFKGSLPASIVVEKIKQGFINAGYDGTIVSLPISDGGDGLIEALSQCQSFETFNKITVPVLGPESKPVKANYLQKGETCIIEMAQAAGLTHIKSSHLHCSQMTTYGLGELILKAYERGARDFWIGLGGSATNEMGLGCFQAMGTKFYDRDHNLIQTPISSEKLTEIYSIDPSFMSNRFKSCSFNCITDVSHPLLGANGATYTFGPQKGATQRELAAMEQGMTHMVDVLEQHFKANFSSVPGAGAAGGLGAGMKWFLGAHLKKGIDTVLDLCQFDRLAKDCDLIVSGEGRLDQQTLAGKVISGISMRANQFGIPLIVLTGDQKLTKDQISQLGITAAFSLCNGPMSLEQSMMQAETLVENLAYNLARTLMLN